MNAILQYVNMLAGAVILYHACSAVSAMSVRTKHGVRLSFVLIAAGGLALVIDPWVPRDLSLDAGQVLAFGMALLLVFDKRCSESPLSSRSLALFRRRDKVSPLPQ